MNEIIYLEPDEEITSVIDKLKVLNPSVKTVSLVIPKGAAILQSVVNLKLLKKQGEVLEKDLSIVTFDRIGRNLASQAGFSVFDNINADKPVFEPVRPQPKTEEIIELDLTGKQEENSQPKGISVYRYDESQQVPQAQEPEPRQEPEPQIEEKEELPIQPFVVKPKNKNAKKKIIFFAGLALIIALGIIFYLFYPKAIITLTVLSEPFEKPLEITIDNNIFKNDESRKAITGELLESEQEGIKKFPATGKKEVGEKAKGSVTVSNDSGTSTKLPSGSELKTSAGLSFKTLSEITIAGATASVDASGNVIKTPGKNDVQVEANEAGDQYNISAASFTVSGYSMLSGKSTASMSGGSSRQLTIVTQNDINNAKNELANEIYSTLHSDLKNKAGGDKILENTIKDEILSSDANKKVNEEASEFEMKVKAKSATISFKENDYREMVVKALGGEVPQDKELILSSSDEISTATSEIDIAHGIIKVTGTVKTRLAPKIDQNTMKNSIKGKNRATAEEIIKQNKDIEAVNVFLRPSWWLKNVPAIDKNIEIKFEYK